MYIETEEIRFGKNQHCKIIKTYWHPEINTTVVFYISEGKNFKNNFYLRLCCEVINDWVSDHFSWRVTNNLDVKKEYNGMLNNTIYKYLISKSNFDEAFDILLEYIPFPYEMNKKRDEVFMECRK